MAFYFTVPEVTGIFLSKERTLIIYLERLLLVYEYVRQVQPDFEMDNYFQLQSGLVTR